MPLPDILRITPILLLVLVFCVCLTMLQYFNVACCAARLGLHAVSSPLTPFPTPSTSSATPSLMFSGSNPDLRPAIPTTLAGTPPVSPGDSITSSHELEQCDAYESLWLPFISPHGST